MLMVRVSVFLCLASSLEAAPPQDAQTETSLEDPIEDVHVAGGGKLLVFKVKNRGLVGIYDAVQRCIAGYLEIGSAKVKLGAGGNVALTYDEEHGEFQSWDLLQRRSIRKRAFAEMPVVENIVMGHERDDLALLRLSSREDKTEDPTDPVSRLRVFGVRDLAPVSFGLSNDTYPGIAHMRGQVDFRATGNMRYISVWAGPSQRSAVVITRGTVVQAILHDFLEEGYLSISSNGTLYTGNGGIFGINPSLKNSTADVAFPSRHRVPDQSLVAATDGLMYLGIGRDGAIQLYGEGSTAPMTSLAPFPNWSSKPTPGERLRPKERPRPSRARSPGNSQEHVLTLDRRIIFAPALGHIVFLPYSDKMIIHRRFDLREALEASGTDYLLAMGSTPPAISGRLWRHRMSVYAKYLPVQYVLEQGPEGMTISDDGELRWQVPSNVTGRTELFVRIRDAKDNWMTEKYQLEFAPSNDEPSQERSF